MWLQKAPPQNSQTSPTEVYSTEIYILDFFLTIYTKSRCGMTDVVCAPESKQKLHDYQGPEGKGQINLSKHAYVGKNCLPRKYSAFPNVCL